MVNICIYDLINTKLFYGKIIDGRYEKSFVELKFYKKNVEKNCKKYVIY